MNYGLYMAASGMSAQMARQDVLSNNLANVSTTAFKPDVLAIRERLPVRQEDNLSFMSSDKLLERLGAGVMPVATRINMSPAALERTGKSLDLGIEGEGFLLVRSGSGESGRHLTRDGRLALSTNGTLVTASEGKPVLNTNGQPIRLDPSRSIEFDTDGTIQQDGAVIATLAFVTVPEPEKLKKFASGLLGTPDGSPLRTSRATGRVMQFHVESSGTNAINTMMAVTSASRAVDSNSTMIGYINEMMGRAINSLGRVS